MDFTTAPHEIASCPPEMQIELVEQVWDRLAHSGWRSELNDEQKAEIDRRLEAHAANPNDVVTWESVVGRCVRRSWKTQSQQSDHGVSNAAK